MLVREVAQRLSLKEAAGMYDMLGMKEPQSSIDQRAADAAASLQDKGYGQPLPLPPLAQSISTVQANAPQQQYIKGLVSQWTQQAPKATVVAKSTTKTKSKTQRSKPGQMPAVVANSKQGQKMLQAYGQPRGGIQNVPEASFTQSISSDQYQKAFETWAAQQLATVEPTTRQTITLAQVKASDVKQELAQALQQVIATANDPQKNPTAVNNYLTIAVAGVTRLATQLRRSKGRASTGSVTGPVKSSQSGQAIVTQQDLNNKLAQDLRLSATQTQALMTLVKDPASLKALLKMAGVQS